MASPTSISTHLRRNGVSMVLVHSANALPAIAYWGAALPDSVDVDQLTDLVTAPKAFNAVDQAITVGILPDASTGWGGPPGIVGRRAQHGWAPSFAAVQHVTGDASDGSSVTFTARDDAAGLTLELNVTMTVEGVVRISATLHNAGRDPYAVDSITTIVPVPDAADEVLDFAGRWGFERLPQRTPFGYGTHLREGRHGRTGHDSAHLLIAGETGFGYADRTGPGVYGVHLAWSGNHRTLAYRSPDGGRLLGGGELLLPGEVVLQPGDRYRTPPLVAVWGAGLDDQAHRLHELVRRERRQRHGALSARPVTLNVWEAVYFDHNPQRLSDLADAAADIGVERFVIDDGWFAGRRDDTAGLGDWTVDQTVWPDGLRPIADHVHHLGMQFGLWFEPEMINPDSDLFRAHPDWVLQVPGREPILARNQLVLNLDNALAYDHILEAISSLVTELRIDYIKWDHNRDLVDAADPAGTAAVHRQTDAFYRLLAELRDRHPELEIEACSSGGARVDLAVIDHVERFWASDSNDPVDRAQINAWTAQLVPPEYIGSHIAAGTNHLTGRASSMPFRAVSALPWHLGIECDVTQLSHDELDDLRFWITTYKSLRHISHGGTLVRTDSATDAPALTGFISPDQQEAFFTLVAATTPGNALGGVTRFRGLDDNTTYTLHATPSLGGASSFLPGWWDQALTAGLPVTGGMLRTVGLRMPLLNAESFIVFTLTAAAANR